MIASSQVGPSDVVVICDSREQLPWDLSPLRMERGTLATGDYTIKGLEDTVAIERKSLMDFVQCCGRERDRFEREVKRLLAYETRAVIVEASWADLEAGNWRGEMKPASVIGSTLGWIAQGVHIIPVGSREAAQRYVSRMLFITYRRHYRRFQKLHASRLGASNQGA